MAGLVEEVGPPARDQVELQGPGALAGGVQDEAGGRLDRAGGADRHEQLRAADVGEDPVHVVGDLTEPHHVGPQLPPPAARAGRPVTECAVPREAVAAGPAQRGTQLPVHVQHPPRPAALVEVVDVLGDHEQVVADHLLESGQGPVAGFGSTAARASRRAS